PRKICRSVLVGCVVQNFCSLPTNDRPRPLACYVSSNTVATSCRRLTAVPVIVFTPYIDMTRLLARIAPCYFLDMKNPIKM
ncbi:hypothetical protein L9F63_019222, partial [Diploptera punctata]